MWRCSFSSRGPEDAINRCALLEDHVRSPVGLRGTNKFGWESWETLIALLCSTGWLLIDAWWYRSRKWWHLWVRWNQAYRRLWLSSTKLSTLHCGSEISGKLQHPSNGMVATLSLSEQNICGRLCLKWYPWATTLRYLRNVSQSTRVAGTSQTLNISRGWL